MAEKKLTPAQARALIRSALNDGYRASQVKNIQKVNAVLSKQQVQAVIDKTLAGSTKAKEAKLKPKPAAKPRATTGRGGTGRGGIGGGINWSTK
jgi:Asp-tRNA(Asn)/Glu-tRNA(Gln) amidotransferase B subunit